MVKYSSDLPESVKEYIIEEFKRKIAELKDKVKQAEAQAYATEEYYKDKLQGTSINILDLKDKLNTTNGAIRIYQREKVSMADKLSQAESVARLQRNQLHRRNMQIKDLKLHNLKGYRIVHYGEDYIAVSKAQDVFKGKVYEITGEGKQLLEAILPVDVKY